MLALFNPIYRLSTYAIDSLMPSALSNYWQRTQLVQDTSKHLSSPLDVRLIPPDKISTEAVAEDDNRRYVLGFATKSGLPFPYCPVSHSAICFLDVASERFLVYGRQSPFGLQLKDWRIETQIDSEKPYLSDGYDFSACMSEAQFNGDEIDQMIKASDQHINVNQSCNMVFSNCYSSATFMMAHGLELMLKREPLPPFTQVESLLQILLHAAKDHLSIGVMNNDTVAEKIFNALVHVKEKYPDALIELPTLESRRASAGETISRPS